MFRPAISRTLYATGTVLCFGLQSTRSGNHNCRALAACNSARRHTGAGATLALFAAVGDHVFRGEDGRAEDVVAFLGARALFLRQRLHSIPRIPRRSSLPPPIIPRRIPTIAPLPPVLHIRISLRKISIIGPFRLFRVAELGATLFSCARGSL